MEKTIFILHNRDDFSLIKNNLNIIGYDVSCLSACWKFDSAMSYYDGSKCCCVFFNANLCRFECREFYISDIDFFVKTGYQITSMQHGIYDNKSMRLREFLKSHFFLI